MEQPLAAPIDQDVDLEQNFVAALDRPFARLAEWLDGPLLGVVRLLVVEALVNAVAAGNPSAHVRLTVRATRIECTVAFRNRGWMHGSQQMLDDLCDEWSLVEGGGLRFKVSCLCPLTWPT